MSFFNLPFSVRIAGADPVDGDRYIQPDIPGRDSLPLQGRAHDGLLVYVQSDKTLYIYDLALDSWSAVGSGGGGALQDGEGTTFNVDKVDLGGTYENDILITSTGSATREFSIRNESVSTETEVLLMGFNPTATSNPINPGPTGDIIIAIDRWIEDTGVTERTSQTGLALNAGDNLPTQQVGTAVLFGIAIDDLTGTNEQVFSGVVAGGSSTVGSGSSRAFSDGTGASIITSMTTNGETFISSAPYRGLYDFEQITSPSTAIEERFIAYSPGTQSLNMTWGDFLSLDTGGIVVNTSIHPTSPGQINITSSLDNSTLLLDFDETGASIVLRSPSVSLPSVSDIGAGIPSRILGVDGSGNIVKADVPAGGGGNFWPLDTTGTITAPVVIEADGQTLEIVANDDLGVGPPPLQNKTAIEFDGTGNILLRGQNTLQSGDWGFVLPTTQGSPVTIYTSGVSGTNGFNVTVGGIEVLSTLNNNGMFYDQDTSANNIANPRWIPDKGYVDLVAGAGGSIPTDADKDLTPAATSGNGDDTVINITGTPVGYPAVYVNGVLANLKGDLTGDCYFSGDNGVTARALNAVVAGDDLFWNGVIAGYDLSTNDRIDLLYNV